MANHEPHTDQGRTQPPPHVNGQDYGDGFPEALTALWDRLPPEVHDLFRSSWNAPNKSYRDYLKEWLTAARDHGWELADCLAMAGCAWAKERAKDGIRRNLGWRNLLRQEWAEINEPPKPPPDPFAMERDGLPPLMTATAFLAAARAPQFLIDPIIQRGFLYTLTARSYHGKTTLMIYLCLCMAMARPFAGLHTEQGRIAYLIGENPDEFAQKLAVACEFWGINPAELPITFLPGAFDLTANLDAALTKTAACGPLSLVVLDTSAAFRYDDSEDDNQQSKLWAQALRSFTRLPGNPAVITPTHPVKNADRLNLLPRGGSAFMNEVDANLTLWADLDARTTELHWQGKLRGPSFKPIAFELRDHPHPTARHRDGRPVQVAVAIPTEAAAPKPSYGRVKPSVELFHSALLDAIVAGEKSGQTTLSAWLTECIRRGLIEPTAVPETSKEANSRTTKFRVAKGDLLAARWIGIDGQRVFNLRL
jgi:AAA domain